MQFVTPHDREEEFRGAASVGDIVKHPVMTGRLCSSVLPWIRSIYLTGGQEALRFPVSAGGTTEARRAQKTNRQGTDQGTWAAMMKNKGWEGESAQGGSGAQAPQQKVLSCGSGRLGMPQGGMNRG